MPFYLVKDAGPFGGAAEVARDVYKTRAEAQHGLRLHRGRWRVLYAASQVEAVKLADAGVRRATAFA